MSAGGKGEAYEQNVISMVKYGYGPVWVPSLLQEVEMYEGHHK